MKMVTVRMLIDTNKDKIGDLREIIPERAEAWVKNGWAEFVDKPRSRKPKNEEEGE